MIIASYSFFGSGSLQALCQFSCQLKAFFINENIDDLSELIGAYQNHLSGIFSLEQYYGDDDIKFLLEHTRGLKQVLQEYSEVSALLEPPSDDADEEQQEDEEEYAAPPIDEENVFYAGTRASNN